MRKYFILIFILLPVFSYASFNEVKDDILNRAEKVFKEWAISFDNAFFDKDERIKKREADYKKYIEIINITEDKQELKDKALEILVKLQAEDKRFSEQLEQVSINIKEYKKIINQAKKEKEELERKTNLYINALMGSFVTILLGMVALFNRWYLIRLERESLRLDIEIKKKQLRRSKFKLDT